MASHISGGEVFYKYIGPGTTPNTDEYRVTVRLFRECTSNGQILNTEVVNIGIFNASNNTLYTILPLNKLWQGDPPVLQNTPGAIPCLTGDGSLCYQMGLFDSVIDLPRTANGYTLSWVRCCRQQVINVENTPYPDSAKGSTFITHIPGTNQLPNGFNSSAEFVVKDTVLVCAGRPFKLDFSAFDPDNDSLAYTFCTGYSGATPGNPNPLPTQTLALSPLPYIIPYSGGSPLGNTVNIDAHTGIISGIAPATPGKYVVMVCVEEYRGGRLINVHHKDFILKIADCSFASAQLNPAYLTCNGFGLQFENQSSSPSIYSYFWDFGVPGVANDTSSQPQPFYNYPDSGTYTVKLVVNRGGSCGDSTTTLAKVYPGFAANFGFVPKCLPDLTAFIDSSTTKYGQVATWNWDFGDTSGTSNTQNPQYAYQTAGTRYVKLTVTNTKGCTDTLTKPLSIRHKPVLTLTVKDTAICIHDSLQIHLSVTPASTVVWQPATNIDSLHALSPTVFPATATTYVVLANDGLGCTNTDSVRVRINSLPTVITIPDTVMCSGTSIQLLTTGTAASYQWQPATSLSSATATSPVASPKATTQYVVTAYSSAGCLSKDSVYAKVNNSPAVTTAGDSTICLGGKARLLATSPATVSYSWRPTSGLDNPNTASPVATPLQTTVYTIAVTDSNTCTSYDSLTITVAPKAVFAITPPYKNICLGDSVQFTASGGQVYRWYPVTNLSNDTAATVIVYPQSTTTYGVVIASTTCNTRDTLHATALVSLPFKLAVSQLNNVDCFTPQARLRVTGGAQYEWSPAATLDNPYSANPIATPTANTTYYVTAGNGTACFERDSIQVKILTTGAPNAYYLASAFTPNGDGHNDCFGVKDWGPIKSIQFSVYNRWGERVFYSESPTGCWDGTYTGVLQASGTYVYQIWANTVCGAVYRKGTVVLAR